MEVLSLSLSPSPSLSRVLYGIFGTKRLVHEAIRDMQGNNQWHKLHTCKSPYMINQAGSSNQA